MPWTAEARAGAPARCISAERSRRSRPPSWRCREARRSDRPYVLVAQQSLIDPFRAPAGAHTLWAYCHVPGGSTVDMTAAIEAQIERFAPGFGELVLARAALARPTSRPRTRTTSAATSTAACGRSCGRCLRGRCSAARARTRRRTRGSISASSSTPPPGGGVHGMCGYHAARARCCGARVEVKAIAPAGEFPGCR